LLGGIIETYNKEFIILGNDSLDYLTMPDFLLFLLYILLFLILDKKFEWEAFLLEIID